MTVFLWAGLAAALMQLVSVDVPPAFARWSAVQMLCLWLHFLLVSYYA